MSKQVKTPRFYVDMPTFLHATGDTDWAISTVGGPELLYMNPSNPYVRRNTNAGNWIFRIGDFENTAKTSFPINFCALLNHNLASENVGFKVRGIHAVSDGANNYKTFSGAWYKANILNAEAISPRLKPQFNGTSIFEIDNSSDGLNLHWKFFGIEFNDEDNNTTIDYDETIPHQLGSFVVGKYWDAPNSPDLNLTMSRRFDGIKRQKTVGGKTLANIYYDGPTEWTMNHPADGTYKYPPFELDLRTATDPPELDMRRAKSGLGRKGLRSWKLTFSYISDDDMWMAYENSSLAPFESPNENFSTVTDTDVPTDDGNSVADFTKTNPMLSDNSFNFVWNCTLGGTLPFIFQPDGPQYK